MTKLTYQHRVHPRAKHLKLSVEADGQLIVTSPPRTSINRIERFVHAKKNWVERQQQKMRQHSFKPVTAEYVWLFGQILTRKTQPTAKSRGRIYEESGRLIFNLPAETLAQPTAVKTKLAAYLKKRARSYLEPRLRDFSQQMGVNYQRLFLREQKTRWGSCSGKKNLNFNWRLVHFEPAIIDYVIIHELAHLKQRNHSKKFWQLVSQFDPDYKTHRQWLRQHLIVTT